MNSYVSNTKGFDHFYKFMADGGICIIQGIQYRIGTSGLVQRMAKTARGDMFQDIGYREEPLARQMDRIFEMKPVYTSQPERVTRFKIGDLVYKSGTNFQDSYWITAIVSGVYFLKSNKNERNKAYIDSEEADETCILDPQFQMREDLDAIINGDD